MRHATPRTARQQDSCAHTSQTRALCCCCEAALLILGRSLKADLTPVKLGSSGSCSTPVPCSNIPSRCRGAHRPRRCCVVHGLSPLPVLLRLLQLLRQARLLWPPLLQRLGQQGPRLLLVARSAAGERCGPQPRWLEGCVSLQPAVQSLQDLSKDGSAQHNSTA